jgi:RNA polymerase sigma-70 factor, ECF subfamily
MHAVPLEIVPTTPARMAASQPAASVPEELRLEVTALPEFRSAPPDLSDLAPILARHSGRVFSVALRMTGDPADAEEVAQDVFLELHRTRPALESEDHLKYWLRRTAVHRSTDRLRRRKRQPENGAEEWMDDLHGVPAAWAGISPGTEHKLDELVRALPETLRTAVVLRYTEEMTPDEIARQLGQPLATVKSHLSRGLNLLRQKAAITMKEYKRARA